MVLLQAAVNKIKISQESDLLNVLDKFFLDFLHNIRILCNIIPQQSLSIKTFEYVIKYLLCIQSITKSLVTQKPSNP